MVNLDLEGCDCCAILILIRFYEYYLLINISSFFLGKSKIGYRIKLINQSILIKVCEIYWALSNSRDIRNMQGPLSFFFLLLMLVLWMVILSSCPIWKINSIILPLNEYGCVYASNTLGNMTALVGNSWWCCKMCEKKQYGF